MKNYVDKNTELRAKADTEFGKFSTQDMNTKSYGKTMEDARKSRNCNSLCKMCKSNLKLAFVEWKSMILTMMKHFCYSNTH